MALKSYTGSGKVCSPYLSPLDASTCTCTCMNLHINWQESFQNLGKFCLVARVGSPEYTLVLEASRSTCLRAWKQPLKEAAPLLCVATSCGISCCLEPPAPISDCLVHAPSQPADSLQTRHGCVTLHCKVVSGPAPDRAGYLGPCPCCTMACLALPYLVESDDRVIHPQVG